MLIFRAWATCAGKGRFVLKKNNPPAQTLSLLLSLFFHRKIFDSEIVLFSFFFNHDRFVLYVLGKDSEFLDISKAQCVA